MGVPNDILPNNKRYGKVRNGVLGNQKRVASQRGQGHGHESELDDETADDDPDDLRRYSLPHLHQRLRGRYGAFKTGFPVAANLSRLGTID